jgi:uncharacterized protein YndB with AHSA1/START domain
VATQDIAFPTETELVITRIFQSPRELVWQAWTQSEHMMRWSCPKDFTLLFCEGDLRVGGAWRAGMRAPDGEEMVMGGEYSEISEPGRLAFSHGWEDSQLYPGHVTQIVVELEEIGEKTKMIFTQSKLASAASRDGHAGGWSGAFDNLDAYLKTL